MLAVLLFSAADEYLQSFTHTRQWDLDDIIADVLGGAVFLMVWFILKVRSKVSTVVRGQNHG